MAKMPPPDCGACGKIEPERMARIIKAVLENISNWEDRLEEIAENSTPGNRVRSLSLLRDMRFAHLSLKRLAGLDSKE